MSLKSANREEEQGQNYSEEIEVEMARRACKSPKTTPCCNSNKCTSARRWRLRENQKPSEGRCTIEERKLKFQTQDSKLDTRGGQA